MGIETVVFVLPNGAEFVAQGTPAEIMADPASLTGAYLAGRRAIPVPARRRPPGERALVLSGCREHNLRDVTLRLPLGLFVVVTGVSGSGKSTLVNDILYRALAQRFYAARDKPGAFDRIDVRGVDGVSLKEKWQDGPQIQPERGGGGAEVRVPRDKLASC